MIAPPETVRRPLESRLVALNIYPIDPRDLCRQRGRDRVLVKIKMDNDEDEQKGDQHSPSDRAPSEKKMQTTKGKMECRPCRLLRFYVNECQGRSDASHTCVSAGR